MINWLFGWLRVPLKDWTILDCSLPLLVIIVAIVALVTVVLMVAQEVKADLNYKRTFRNELRYKNKKAEKEQGKWNK